MSKLRPYRVINGTGRVRTYTFTVLLPERTVVILEREVVVPQEVQLVEVCGRVGRDRAEQAALALAPGATILELLDVAEET